MKYIALKSVIDAFGNCYHKTKNRFWGLLAVLHAINKKIEPGNIYNFSSNNVSLFLDNLFSIHKVTKIYQDQPYYVIFSKYWLDKIPTAMFNIIRKINIYDVVVWYFRKADLNDDVSTDDLINKFLEDIHLDKADSEKIFIYEPVKIDFINEPYTDEELIVEIEKKYSKKNNNNNSITFEQLFIANDAGALGSAPFFQTLYANQEAQQCLIITKFSFKDYYLSNSSNMNKRNTKVKQIIYYGAPGTGKSHDIKIDVGTKGDLGITDEATKDEMRDDNNIRITFHPDTDYASFVGCYKPMPGNKPDSIVYKYQPQAFVKAYVEAWKRYLDKDVEGKNYYLIIEEINRGNCAQIFGDMFQLLDREYDGYSSYEVDTDSDLQRYLEEAFANTDFSDEAKESDDKLKNGEKMILPPNLSILATMNTSDQSLFPMDSAFKRRWQMHYVKINTDDEKVKPILFKVGDEKYSWSDFVKAINAYIQDKNGSTSKQIGQWFARCDDDEDDKGKPTTISFDNFCSKVLFYLFTDAFRDDMNFGHLFNDENEDFFFENLYDESVEKRALRVKDFLRNLQQEDPVKAKDIKLEPKPSASENKETKIENE